MKHKKWVIEVIKGDEVVRKSDIVLAFDWYGVIEDKVYKDMKKTLIGNERLNIRLARKDEIMAL
jgi:hypothetical protein